MRVLCVLVARGAAKVRKQLQHKKQNGKQVTQREESWARALFWLRREVACGAEEFQKTLPVLTSIATRGLFLHGITNNRFRTRKLV